jgi:hypothetical protein
MRKSDARKHLRCVCRNVRHARNCSDLDALAALSRVTHDTRARTRLVLSGLELHLSHGHVDARARPLSRRPRHACGTTHPQQGIGHASREFFFTIQKPRDKFPPPTPVCPPPFSIAILLITQWRSAMLLQLPRRFPHQRPIMLLRPPRQSSRSAAAFV